MTECSPGTWDSSHLSRFRSMISVANDLDISFTQSLSKKLFCQSWITVCSFVFCSFLYVQDWHGIVLHQSQPVMVSLECINDKATHLSYLLN